MSKIIVLRKNIYLLMFYSCFALANIFPETKSLAINNYNLQGCYINVTSKQQKTITCFGSNEGPCSSPGLSCSSVNIPYILQNIVTKK